MKPRRKSRQVIVGKVPIGGDAPITVQSMTNTKTEDIAATVHQILQLEEAGCELVRVTVPNETAAQAIKEIKRQIHIPLIADIHFNYRMALLALGNGVDKIRINPGNIGSPQRIKAVLEKAKERNVPLRIGVNAGSLEKTLLDKYGKVCAEALVESALRHVEICQDFGFDDIVISIKAAQVPMMIDSYRMIAEKVDFPLHLGVTEAGTTRTGSIKSAIGIGTFNNGYIQVSALEYRRISSLPADNRTCSRLNRPSERSLRILIIINRNGHRIASKWNFRRW